MDRFLNISGLLLVLAGIVLCWLAFETVRMVIMTLLFHWGGIAAILAGIVAWYLWRSLRRD